MKKGWDYQKNLKLRHHQVPAIVNKETGEIKEVRVRESTLPEGSEVHAPNLFFNKRYTQVWRFLKSSLTPTEYMAADEMALLAKAGTGSLEPLNDETTLSHLSDVLGVSINRIKPVLERLFDIGVYAQFKVSDAQKGYTKYWILNPYLSFSGKIIKSDIVDLFKGTHCAKAATDSTYRYENPKKKTRAAKKKKEKIVSKPEVKQE